MMRWDLLSFSILLPCCLSTKRKITGSLAKGPKHTRAGQVALASDRELCPFPPLHGTHTQQPPPWSLWMCVCITAGPFKARGNIKDPICYFPRVAWVSKGNVWPGLEWGLTKCSDQEAGLHCLHQDFSSTLALLTSKPDRPLLGCWGCPVHCRMVSSFPVSSH